MELTTVAILRMWLFTVALPALVVVVAQVITAALDVEQNFVVNAVTARYTCRH